VRSFEEIKSPRDELAREGAETHQKVEKEKRQPSASAIEKHGLLAEPQMGRMARVRGLFALMNSASGKKCMEFLNRVFSAAIMIRRCALLEMIRAADAKQLYRAMSQVRGTLE